MAGLLKVAASMVAPGKGVLAADESIGTMSERQSLASGVPFPAAARDLGIHPGIKVDTGVAALPFAGGATVTEGPAANRARAGAASQAARGTGAGADG